MHPLLSKYLFYYPVTLMKGEFIGKYLGFYEKFQMLPRVEIEAYQIKRLSHLLQHVYEKSSYYKRVFDEHGVHPSDVQTLDDMHKLPYLSKSDLVINFSEIAVARQGFFVSQKTTGGSTGQAVTLLKNSRALARERAATWRSYAWAGIKIGDSQARFWGTPLHVSQHFKSQLIDFIANRKRFSAFDINEQKLESFYQQLTKFKPAYLYGYVSVIEIFAKFLKKKNYELPASVKCVITTSEVLSSRVKEGLKSSLKLEVFNEYGCGEVGSIAHECEHGEMHVMDDNLILEIIPSAEDSSAGEIVVTDLFNYATPLIRYKLGDYASKSKGLCTCGRTLSVIGNIHGRAYDCIHTEDGKVFHPEVMMYIFEDIKSTVGGVEQFQVVQDSLNSLLVRIVKDDNYCNDTEVYISKIVASRLHKNMKVEFEYVDEIKREKSGKLRLVKSNL